MEALRIPMSQMSTWASPAGEQGSREKVEEEAVGSLAGAGDLAFIILLPSEKL